tara:strand:- start:1217 stop:1522 length:306 start_codon:yes stop_codon:yes gene_type:complete
MNGYFSATAAGTDAGATATRSADATQAYVVCNISGHTDLDGVVTIESPAATILWETKIDVSVDGTSFDFNPKISTDRNVAVLGKIAGSTADCQVTISGEVI